MSKPASRAANVMLGLVAAGAGAGVTMLARWALGLPSWGPTPVLVVGVLAGLFAYAAAVSRGRVFSLDLTRGALFGLAGTGVGVGMTVLVRRALGLTLWNEGSVLTVGILAGVTAYLFSVGVLRYWLRWVTGAPSAVEEKPARPSWTRYFNVDTNHKVIGIQYMVTALLFLPFAVALQLLARLYMAKLGVVTLSPGTYESVISDHGIVMLFIVVLPAFSGLMNYFVPLLIGARDMAFPRLNAFSYWLVPPAGLLTVFSLMAGGSNAGWTLYPPLSAQFQPAGTNLVLLGVFIGGFSSILTAINILATVFKSRAPGMRFFRMPVFVWSALATAGLALVFTPFIAIALLMVLLERVLGMGFFQPQMGGQVLLYQYLFWFYSHPAVYIFVLPGLGIISDIIPVFSRKPLFGYRGVAVSSPAIALGGTLVFAHHMFAAGMPAFLRIPFMVTTLLVAVPTGVKVFAWVATMWMGKIHLRTPLLFVLSAIIFFLIGGLTGVPLGIVPVDLYLHDTYYVVGHFHAMFFGGFMMPLMAALYYWFPKVTGRMMREGLGRAQWLLMTLGSLLIFVPMIGLGLEGMRRRVAYYDPIQGFQQLHLTTAAGGSLVFAGLVLLAYNVVVSLRRGKAAGPNPWGARTLEWLVPSPPPEENFAAVPEVLDRPHVYGVPGAVHARVGAPAASEESKGE